MGDTNTCLHDTSAPHFIETTIYQGGDDCIPARVLGEAVFHRLSRYLLRDAQLDHERYKMKVRNCFEESRMRKKEPVTAHCLGVCPSISLICLHCSASELRAPAPLA